MQRRSLDLITTYVATLGALASAGTWLALGTNVGVGAVVGSALAVGNWLGLRWLLTRLLASGTQSKAGFMVLLGLKTLVFMTIVSLLVVRATVSPLGLVIGLSALVVGLVAGALHGRPAVEHVTGEES